MKTIEKINKKYPSRAEAKINETLDCLTALEEKVEKLEDWKRVVNPWCEHEHDNRSANHFLNCECPICKPINKLHEFCECEEPVFCYTSRGKKIMFCAGCGKPIKPEGIEKTTLKPKDEGKPSTNTRDTMLRTLETIILDNTSGEFGTVDYDGVAEDVITLVHKLKRIKENV